jgi:ABC-type lipoprotein export system ATPase subunit
MALLEAHDISRSYGTGRHVLMALSRVSIAVDRGEMVVITGPSGAGKSTLLQLLSGLDRPDSGEVRCQGRSLMQLSEPELARLRNEIFGFIFQTPHLLLNQTVRENVALPFAYGSILSAREIAARCDNLLDYVGLAAMQDRYPGTLSGGEMQRLVFARALVRKPLIIFADEPTGSLDDENSQRIMQLLREQVTQGAAVVLVTHEPGIAAMGSRIVSLNKSKANGDRT